jgi:hypothetical protein
MIESLTHLIGRARVDLQSFIPDKDFLQTRLEELPPTQSIKMMCPFF